MKLSTSEPGMVVSALGHVTFLVAGLLAFAAPAPLPENEEVISVEVVDPSALNQVTRGERKAEKVLAQPLQRAERQAEIVERKEAGEAKQDTPAPPTRPAELKTADDNAAAPLPPARAAALPKTEPTVKPPEPTKPLPPQKSEAQQAEAKAEQRREELAKLAEEAEIASKARQAEENAKAAAKAKAEAQAKAEALAKAKADAQAKAEAQAKADAKAQAETEAAEVAKEKAEAVAKAKAEADAKAKVAALAKAKQEAEAKAKRELEVAKNFNAADIAKLLQSKEPAQSSGAAAPQVNRTASLGTERGASQKLSPSMRGQLVGLIQEQLLRCWSVPIALANAPSKASIVPSVRMKLNTDGSLIGQAVVINSSSDPLFRVAADSALVATRRCSPLKIPPQFSSYYDDWRDVVVNFDARDT